MNKRQRQRLEKLRDFLRRDAPWIQNDEPEEAYFNLGSWATAGFPKRECGSTACALGWATVLFPRLLKLVTDDFSAALTVKAPRSNTYDFDAGCEVFGLTELQSEYLFEPAHEQREDEWILAGNALDTCNSAAAVAWAIDEILEGRGPQE